MVKYPKKTRQTVFLTVSAIANSLLVILIGWLWIFPVKGLPYGSGGTIFLSIINQGYMSCDVFKALHLSSSIWVFVSFLLICFDRMLAIYFPLIMIKFGYKSAIYSSLGMIVLCVVFCSSTLTPFRSIKIGSKIFCSTMWDRGKTVTKFMKIWITIYRFSSNVPMVIIFLLNISLISKVIQIHTKAKGLSETLTKRDQTEVRATIIVLILSVLFMIGFVPLLTIYCLIDTFLKGALHDHSSPNEEFEIIYHMVYMGLNFAFLMASLNILIYYSRMKLFRDECNRLIGGKMEMIKKILLG